MPVKMSAREVVCGHYVVCSEKLRDTLKRSGAESFDFVASCFGHPQCKFDPLAADSNESSVPEITRADFEISSTEWNKSVLGIIPTWVKPDSPDPRIRRISCDVLEKQLQYATYLTLPYVIIKIDGEECANTAHIIRNFFELRPNANTHILIQIPACVPTSSDGEKITAPVDPWEWWNAMRCFCENDKRVSILLEVTADLPEAPADARWFGEPVSFLLFDTSIFLTNQTQSPVLSRAHQRFVSGFYPMKVRCLISGESLHNSKGLGLSQYRRYLDFLWQNYHPPDLQYAEFARGYEDYLQVPLQPLSDHLEANIYEIFEKDPVKYSEYGVAIEKCLKNLREINSESFVATVMVVGAGRGPLVTACIDAAARAECPVRIFAVEKNPNAVTSLRYLKSTKWSEKNIEIVCEDMRNWKPEHKADLLVSELLGSFGDNELSPECLDGALHLMKDDGISIPQSYSSYIAPLQSQKLYQEVRYHSWSPNRAEPESSFDVAFVVRVTNAHSIDRPKRLFHFQHPNRDLTENSRYERLEFRASGNCIMHGFIGYFDANLYDDVRISILPETHSAGMFSWFPIFFPLRTPVNCKENEKIVAHFWRLKDATKVWYEWCLESPVKTSIQNPNGKHYKMML